MVIRLFAVLGVLARQQHMNFAFLAKTPSTAKTLRCNSRLISV
jgi:hypothetical protein